MPQSSYAFYLLVLIGTLTLKAALLATFIAYSSFGLGPDEAQYWTWSQEFSFGYYSKPPGIAWQIALSTYLFGNTEFGVRFGALVLGSLIPIASFFLAKACQLPARTCFLASLAFALSPLGVLSNILAITDVGMVLFWTLAAIKVCQALKESLPLPYYAIGFYILLGALFKWPIFAFWVPLLALLAVRPHLFSKHLFGGLALSFLALGPSIIWNIQHNWPTFKHVFATIKAPLPPGDIQSASLKGNFFEFIGMQALLMFPLAFLLLGVILKAYYRIKSKISAPLHFLLWSALGFLLSYTMCALFKKIQGNWCDFIYPQIFVLLAWGAVEALPHLKKWLLTSLALSTLTLATLPLFTSHFKHNTGWQHLPKELIAAGYNPKEHFLFGDKYQTCSLLSFYSPTQQRAYFLNLNHIRNNQFSFWPGMDIEQVGNTGFFVCFENEAPLEKDKVNLIGRYRQNLHPFFSNVEFIAAPTLSRKKLALIFKCTAYNGKIPTKSDQW